MLIPGAAYVHCALVVDYCISIQGGLPLRRRWRFLSFDRWLLQLYSSGPFTPSRTIPISLKDVLCDYFVGAQ